MLTLKNGVAAATTAQDSWRVVGWAVSMNMLDATFKFAACWLTGSHALFAEAIHSSADTFNQARLFASSSAGASFI